MLLDQTRGFESPLSIPTDIETKSAVSLSADPTVASKRATRYRARRTLADRVREALIVLSKGDADIRSHEETPWASITFSGTRHEVVLEFNGTRAAEVGEEFIAKLPDHEFTIPAQLVAEASVTEVDHSFGADERLVVTVVLLLLEEV